MSFCNLLVKVQVLKSKVEESETGGDILANLQFSLEEAEKKMTEIEKENALLKYEYINSYMLSLSYISLCKKELFYKQNKRGTRL